MRDHSLRALALVAALLLAGCGGGAQFASPTDGTTTVEPTTQSAGTTTNDSASTTASPATTTSGDVSTRMADAPATSDGDVSTTDGAGPVSDGEGTTPPDNGSVATPSACPYRGPNDDDVVRESGACLPFDADTVYRRVAEMTGETVPGPATVQAIPASETRRFSFPFNPATFQATMGVVPEREPDVFVPGYAVPNARANGTVLPGVTLRYVGLWDDPMLQDELGITYTAADAEVTAAHEFLHVVQFHQESRQRLARNLTTTGANVDVLELAILEGSASFFESEYQRRYMNTTTELRSVTGWTNASPYALYALGPYVTGSHYARWYLNGSTENFERLYDDPPVSMEQVIHQYEPDEERPLDLTVRGEASSNWVVPTFPRTMGELFLRASLRAGVDGPTAARGAAGWGQDRVLTFQNASYSRDGLFKTGYAWAIRFDDQGEAAEFERIFDDWLNETGTFEDGAYVASADRSFRFVRVSESTVVVLAGHEAFVRRTTVAGNTTHVTVEHTNETQVTVASTTAPAPSTSTGATGARPHIDDTTASPIPITDRRGRTPLGAHFSQFRLNSYRNS
jgi:hypothetical protein